MISKKDVIKFDNEIMKGICSECGQRAKHYRKLDGSFWVHYELCKCSRMFNFTRKYVNHKEQWEAFKDHMFTVWGMRIK